MKKICLIGGGHGVSRLIKGFKNIDCQVDAILTSSDNGGHTGELVKEFNLPALGDLRNVLESVMNEPVSEFLSYRFKSLHGINNVSLGNLMLASLALEKGVKGMLKEVNSLVDSKYRFFLANNEYVRLMASNSNGEVIEGEVNIGNSNDIKSLYLEKEGEVDEGVIKAIKEAEIIVFSFGSFYTSLGAVLVSDKIRAALKDTQAKIVYIPNLVSQKETTNYSVEDLVDFIEKTIDRRIDKVILISNKIKRKYLKKYKKENKTIINHTQQRDNYYFYPILEINDWSLRHDIVKLGEIIVGE